MKYLVRKKNKGTTNHLVISLINFVGGWKAWVPMEHNLVRIINLWTMMDNKSSPSPPPPPPHLCLLQCEREGKEGAIGSPLAAPIAVEKGMEDGGGGGERKRV